MYNYDTLKELGDEASVRSAGKVMTKGKDYVVEDGYNSSMMVMVKSTNVS